MCPDTNAYAVAHKRRSARPLVANVFLAACRAARFGVDDSRLPYPQVPSNPYGSENGPASPAKRGAVRRARPEASRPEQAGPMNDHSGQQRMFSTISLCTSPSASCVQQSSPPALSRNVSAMM